MALVLDLGTRRYYRGIIMKTKSRARACSVKPSTWKFAIVTRRTNLLSFP